MRWKLNDTRGNARFFSFHDLQDRYHAVKSPFLDVDSHSTAYRGEHNISSLPPLGLLISRDNCIDFQGGVIVKPGSFFHLIRLWTYGFIREHLQLQHLALLNNLYLIKR